MNIRIPSIVCALVVGTAPLAIATDARGKTVKPAPKSEDPAALYAQGDEAYQAERFDDALVAFMKSYELSKEPALLFNVGQCHRKLAHHEQALAFFERYLAETTDISNRAEVEALAAEERAIVDEQKRAAAAPAATPVAPEPPAPEETDGPLGQPPVLWAVIGGAAAAVVTGTVIAAVLLWPAPEPESGSLGTVDLREGN